METEELNIKRENNSLKEEGNEIAKKLNNRDNLVSKISNRKQRLEKLLRSNEQEDQEEEEKIKNTINKLNDRIFDHIIQLRDHSRKLTDNGIKFDVLIANEINLSRLIRSLSDKFEEDNTALKQAELEYMKVKQRINQAKDHAKKLHEIASRNAPLTNELKDQFALLPDDLDELDEEIRSISLALSNMYEQDSSVIEEFKRCEEQLKSIQLLLSRNEEDYLQKSNKIADTRKNWVNEVKKIVKLLNQYFSNFMSHIKCSGEVRLAMDPPEEFSSYGIEIRVKFRDNTNLQTLNAQLQSGGEKSVSTMLYLLSLQSIVSFPFRLVDEINQGMDPVNERMIFSQVVEISTKPGAQYFLITPKLLLDLPFQKGITVLCVFNGPWTLTQDIFNNYSF